MAKDTDIRGCASVFYGRLKLNVWAFFLGGGGEERRLRVRLKQRTVRDFVLVSSSALPQFAFIFWLRRPTNSSAVQTSVWNVSGNKSNASHILRVSVCVCIRHNDAGPTTSLRLINAISCFVCASTRRYTRTHPLCAHVLIAYWGALSLCVLQRTCVRICVCDSHTHTHTGTHSFSPTRQSPDTNPLRTHLLMVHYVINSPKVLSISSTISTPPDATVPRAGPHILSAEY